VLPETQFMQIGQLESKITDRLAMGNWPSVMFISTKFSKLKVFT